MRHERLRRNGAWQRISCRLANGQKRSRGYFSVPFTHQRACITADENTRRGIRRGTVRLFVAYCHRGETLARSFIGFAYPSAGCLPALLRWADKQTYARVGNALPIRCLAAYGQAESTRQPWGERFSAGCGRRREIGAYNRMACDEIGLVIQRGKLDIDGYIRAQTIAIK